MKKLKTKEFKGYTPEQLAYFQAQDDMNDGVDMDTEFEDLDGESDWFMD